MEIQAKKRLLAKYREGYKENFDSLHRLFEGYKKQVGFDKLPRRSYGDVLIRHRALKEIDKLKSGRYYRYIKRERLLNRKIVKLNKEIEHLTINEEV